ncbi:MAG: PilZ domain-containing protein [Chloroflexota bacterium]|nr:PilZ domain-containing protein [Chloroflexota bacterium]
MPRSKPRPTPRKSRLLTAFRCLEGSTVTSSGFGRTLEVSADEAVLETPDAFPVGQVLMLEFLLDENQLVEAQGHVTRINKGKALYRVKVAFEEMPAKTRRLLARQAAG